jgi:hypothetical protein
VFYLRFKVYALHCVLAMQARVCGPGRTGCTEPTRIRIRIRAIRATGLLIYSYNIKIKHRQLKSSKRGILFAYIYKQIYKNILINL